MLAVRPEEKGKGEKALSTTEFCLDEGESARGRTGFHVAYQRSLQRAKGHACFSFLVS